jgi:hypothetical protein
MVLREMVGFFCGFAAYPRARQVAARLAHSITDSELENGSVPATPKAVSEGRASAPK